MQQCRGVSSLSAQASPAVSCADGKPEKEYPSVPSLQLFHEVHYQKFHNGLELRIISGKLGDFP